MRIIVQCWDMRVEGMGRHRKNTKDLHQMNTKIGQANAQTHSIG